MKKRETLYLSMALIMLLGACGIPSLIGEHAPQFTSTRGTSENITPTSGATGLPVTGHLMQPADIALSPQKMVVDVDSLGTGAEGRAPYGDSYKINRFERPFLKDMTYVPDIDIHKFGLSEDEDWYYVSIQLIGDGPNNPMGIHYGAEIDLNNDGFGDYIIWAHPPYMAQWDTSTVQVSQDTNLDSAGRSSGLSEAVFDGNGYDTLLFDGSRSQNSDPDLAWVRMSTDQTATIQIAFKKSLTGPSFLLGVVADGGLKDVSKYDYVDYFTEAEAGSPVRNKQYYPLGLVYAVDNTCWQGYGSQATAYGAKSCQPIPPPTHRPPPEATSAPTPCPYDLNCGPTGGTFNTSTCQCEFQ